MEIINKTLDTYSNLIYFWNNEPSNLGRMSNNQLKNIKFFIFKFPGGLLNGYPKMYYIKAISYIIKWRTNDEFQMLAIVESYRLQKAEQKAELLTKYIINSLEKTEKQYA